MYAIAAVLAALVVCAGCSKARDRAVEDPDDRAQRDRANDATGSTPTTAELIVGRWLMLKEEPADGKGGFFEQKRRLLELKADGAYHVENYYNSIDSTWRLDGTTLVVGAARFEVEKVDESTLVLVEDLPEIYLRDGPPRRVRNTYRRVSESELGPMLGQPITVSTPVTGTYTAAYSFAMNKLPTMEITIDRRITGAATLVLGADGTAHACFGVAQKRAFSESKYSSEDGKHHSRGDEDFYLAGMRGTWSTDGDDALVTMDRLWRSSCNTDAGEGDAMAPNELHCTAIAANDTLPVPTLACRIESGQSMLNEIAINPADTERAGPYTMQSEPRGHISTDPGRPWLFLGAAPGLHIHSRDGRRDGKPTVSFRAEEVTFDEKRFVAP